MSIEISRDKCIGCGRCGDVCPGTLIFQDSQGKAAILHPERCWGCAACVKECPAQAIAMFLGSDMGGLGGRLTVRREGSLLHWTVTMPDGAVRTLTVNSRESNRY